MNIQELTAKVFLTDVKPEDIHAIGNGSTSLVYVIDTKAKPTNATWWHIVWVMMDNAKTLAVKCTLFHGNLARFIDHKGISYQATDKELDCVHIRINNINRNESEWVIEYY